MNEAKPLNIEQLWSAEDVARFLGASRSWVYARVASGEMPHLRLSGQMVRFDPDEVRNWARGHRKGAATNVVAFSRGSR